MVAPATASMTPRTATTHEMTWISVASPAASVTPIPVTVAVNPAVSATVELPPAAVAPASARAPGTLLPPPSRQVPAG
jgi:hypothetical protein